MYDVTDNLRCLQTRWVNVFALRRGGAIALIDTGWGHAVNRVSGAFERAGWSFEQVELIALTHAHRDHAGGLAELASLCPNARIVAHPEEAAQVRARRPFPASAMTPTPGVVPRLSTLALRLTLNTLPEMADVGRLESLDGRPLGFGLTPIDLPGHSPGHTGYLWEPGGVLFGGDIMMALRRPGPSLLYADRDQARASLERVASMDFSCLCLGHGRPIDRDARGAVRGVLETWSDVVEGPGL